MDTPHLKADGRRKAWNREGKGPDGLSRAIEKPCDRDIRIFSALEKYPILDTYHLFELCGGKDITRFKERLRLLSDPPNNYILWPKQQTRRANNYLKPNLWSRARRAKAFLLKRGIAVNENAYTEYNDLFEHQYFCYATFASIELGGAKLDVLHMPPVKVSISKQFGKDTERKTFNYTNDGMASITFSNGVVGHLQIESENENSVRRTNLDQPSFLKKFLAIRHIMENKLYKTEWGFPNLLTLVVSPYPDKIAEMKKVVLEETDGKGVPYILFQTVVGFDDPYQSFRPRPELFTGTWERTGIYPPFSLSTPPRN